MESLARYLLRLVAVAACLAVAGLVVAVAIAAYFGRTSTMDLGQATFYAGTAMMAVAAFVIMPFQGVGGAGMGGGMGDFLRVMTLTANVTDWEALHRQDREHTRRGMPVAVCLGLAGFVLFAGGLIVTWVLWSGSS